MARVSLFMIAASCGASFCFCLHDAQAGDAERGRLLVQTHCIACHGTPAPPRGDVAGAPPFDSIASKHGSDASALSAAILGPHPKMNFMPAPDEARAIAAYLSGLPR